MFLISQIVKRGLSALKHGKEMFPISQLAEDARETGQSHVHDLHGALAEDAEETGRDVNNCILISQSRLDSLMVDYEYVHSARTPWYGFRESWIMTESTVCLLYIET